MDPKTFYDERDRQLVLFKEIEQELRTLETFSKQQMRDNLTTKLQSLWDNLFGEENLRSTRKATGLYYEDTYHTKQEIILGQSIGLIHKWRTNADYYISPQVLFSILEEHGDDLATHITTRGNKRKKFFDLVNVTRTRNLTSLKDKCNYPSDIRVDMPLNTPYFFMDTSSSFVKQLDVVTLELVLRVNHYHININLGTRAGHHTIPQYGSSRHIYQIHAELIHLIPKLKAEIIRTVTQVDKELTLIDKAKEDLARYIFVASL